MRITLLSCLSSIVILLSSVLSLAVNAPNSMFNRKTTTGQNLYQTVLSQGVAEEPVNLLFRMFDYNAGRIANTKTAVIVDYSLISVEKRLYFLHLDTGVVERFYVSHGINSGVLETRSFSNLMDSWKSSIGFYYAKGTYNSAKNGPSLKLEGIDRSNDNAKDRLIVLHGAKYVSDDFIQRNGRLGWSQGCFAVALEVLPVLLNSLQNGSLLLSYHKDLWKYARQYPTEQEVMGNEVVPPGVNIRITPEEQVDPIPPADSSEYMKSLVGA
ncbi:murein L,D-transpeptidase catalytic domain family protein [Bdellovibrio sp. ZAP7]|uniref:murein L,D-transpeptidase catalytic domain family protein n=1 Tax=Bdellovibrio sp. ZAP7 TaxID=2231053 RepID=UPI001FEE3C01|nr:murein L,D-transpeptidase catalytic domain family protein [Bdellovibrio sp. ZAP7]